MAINFFVGSFPNSQVKPRSPVTLADTDVITLTTTIVQILTANSARVKTIIKNEGPDEMEYAYNMADFGTNTAFVIEADGAITVEGSAINVWAKAVNTTCDISIDDRLG